MKKNLKFLYFAILIATNFATYIFTEKFIQNTKYNSELVDDSHNKEVDYIKYNQHNNINKMIEGVKKDNSELYSEGYSQEILYGSYQTCFYYSFLMSQINNSPKAYKNIYDILETHYLNQQFKDSSINYFALYNLAKANELKKIEFTSELEKIKDKNGKLLHSNYFLEKMKTRR